MPKRGDKEFLLDIIEAIKRIELYTKELSYPRIFAVGWKEGAALREWAWSFI